MWYSHQLYVISYLVIMLVPKKVKHRKWQKGRSRGRLVETRGTHVAFGAWGLQSQGAHWITSRQIEAARRKLSSCNPIRLVESTETPKLVPISLVIARLQPYSTP